MTTDPEDDNRLAMYRRLLDSMPPELREKFVNAAFLAGLSEGDCVRLLAQPSPVKPRSNLLLDTIETLESARKSLEKTENIVVEGLKMTNKTVETYLHETNESLHAYAIQANKLAEVVAERFKQDAAYLTSLSESLAKTRRFFSRILLAVCFVLGLMTAAVFSMRQTIDKNQERILALQLRLSAVESSAHQ